MKTTETKLLTVQVPLDANNIEVQSNNASEFECTLNYRVNKKDFETPLPGLSEDFQIITTVHKEDFQIVFSPGFEPEKHVKLDLKTKDTFGNVPALLEAEFLSKLKAENGVYFDNPLGDRPPFQESLKYINESQLDKYEKDLAAWQEAEAKVVKNKLVVLGVKES